MTGENLLRLERTGLAAWQLAEALRDARLRWPVDDGDRLAALAGELEDLARTVAGEVAMQLRAAEERGGRTP